MNAIRRRRLLATGLALAAGGLAACRHAAPTDDFFRPGPGVPASLPADGVFPQGRRMHIGGYSPGHVAQKQLGGIVPLELARTSGFTVAGPYYGAFAGSRATVERAAELGMHVAAQLEVPPELRFAKGEDPLALRGARMTALPEAALREWVRSDMANFLTNPVLERAVSCWAIAPEELRHWRKPELDYEQAFLRAVAEFDPRRRPAFMYEPNNRDTNGLLKTGPGQGFVLEGSYVHGYGWDVRRSLRINWAMDQMTGASERDGRVVVPGLQLSQDMPGFTAKDLAADPSARARLRRLLRHDVCLALARGARGFQVWSLHPYRPNLTTYLELVNGYGEVFRELTGPDAGLREAVLFGERRGDVAVEVTGGPAFIAAPPKEGTLEAVEGTIDVRPDRWPSVRLANLALGAGRVMILVNSADAAVRVRLTGLPAAARLSVASGGDAAAWTRTAAGAEVSLEPFAALILGVSPAPDGRRP